MPRVKRGFKARRRRNKILKAAKGYRGGHSKQLRTATVAVSRAGMYAYRDRRNRKRDFRRLWIVRINARAAVICSASLYYDGTAMVRLEAEVETQDTTRDATNISNYVSGDSDKMSLPKKIYHWYPTGSTSYYFLHRSGMDMNWRELKSVVHFVLHRMETTPLLVFLS